jgi:hypothetical protein
VRGVTRSFAVSSSTSRANRHELYLPHTIAATLVRRHSRQAGSGLRAFTHGLERLPTVRCALVTRRSACRREAETFGAAAPPLGEPPLAIERSRLKTQRGDNRDNSSASVVSQHVSLRCDRGNGKRWATRIDYDITAPCFTIPDQSHPLFELTFRHVKTWTSSAERESHLEDRADECDAEGPAYPLDSPRGTVSSMLPCRQTGIKPRYMTVL